MTRSVGAPGHVRSPLLDWPGAVPAEGLDSCVALHYGDPRGEQRVVFEGAGLLDRGTREVIGVAGDRPLSWLEEVTTQRLSDLPNMYAREALVLSDEGYVRHHMYVSLLGSQIIVITGTGLGGPLLRYLESVRDRRIRLQDLTGVWTALNVIGPRTERVLTRVGVPKPLRSAAVSLAGGGWLWTVPYPGIDRVTMGVPTAQVEQAARRLVRAGARPIGTGVNDALRVENRAPRLGVDTDERTLPQEVGWDRVAVAMDRDFRGRAAVARALESGRPPRRLVRLRIAGKEPAYRAAVVLDGREVGVVGTTAWDARLGPVALALVDSAVPEGTELLVEGSPARLDPARPPAPVT